MTEIVNNKDTPRTRRWKHFKHGNRKKDQILADYLNEIRVPWSGNAVVSVVRVNSYHGSMHGKISIVNQDGGQAYFHPGCDAGGGKRTRSNGWLPGVQGP